MRNILTVFTYPGSSMIIGDGIFNSSLNHRFPQVVECRSSDSNPTTAPPAPPHPPPSSSHPPESSVDFQPPF
ncbi:hypothetical protein L2E82_11569 [Cichorium intybus]|uniref:Uncharacterized protein n=1 Tax=Cichorium intybus TaxID=13427 RepID=A0ACB9GDJ4_CICIN|nr:hypothetical protein L2E82_11569 [Cichorium intybus]